jgi:hypothetical protein
MSEARIDRLEARLARVEQAIIRLEAGLPPSVLRLATKAGLADKPRRHYNWSVRAAMVAAYTAALAAGAVSAVLAVCHIIE